MKYLKIGIGIVLLGITFIIGLSAYNTFQNRMKDKKIDDLVGQFQNKLKAKQEAGHSLYKIKNCKIVIFTDLKPNIEMECKDQILIDDVTSFDKVQDKFVFQQDGVKETLIFYSKVKKNKAELICRLSWPLTAGPITKLGDVNRYGMCNLKLENYSAWLSLDEKKYFEVNDGTDFTKNDILSFSQKDIELNWNDPKGKTLSNTLTYEVTFEVDTSELKIR